MRSSIQPPVEREVERNLAGIAARPLAAGAGQPPRPIGDGPSAIRSTPGRSRWRCWLVLVLGLVLAQVSDGPVSAQSGDAELRFEPAELQLDCMGSERLRLRLLAPGAGAEAASIRLFYDPRLVELDRVLAPSGRFQMQVESGEPADLSALATAEAEGAEVTVAPSELRVQLDARRPGSPWPESLLVLRLRAGVSGPGSIMASARLERSDGSVELVEGIVPIEVDCPGMTPVPPLDGPEAEMDAVDEENDEAGDEEKDEAVEVESGDGNAEIDADAADDSISGDGVDEESASSTADEGYADSDEAPAQRIIVRGSGEDGEGSPSSLPVAGPSRAPIRMQSGCWLRLGWGDSLLELSAGRGLDALLRLNGLPAPGLARPGMLLRLPDCGRRG